MAREEIQLEYEKLHQETEGKIRDKKITRDQAQPIMNEGYREYLLKMFAFTKNEEYVAMFASKLKTQYLTIEKKLVNKTINEDEFKEEIKAVCNEFENIITSKSKMLKSPTTVIDFHADNLIKEEKDYMSAKQNKDITCVNRENIFEDYLKNLFK